MKKIALSLLAVVLMLTLVCGTALAVTGDITVKAAKAYSDPELTKYVGTIPKYTSVLVRAYGSYADVYVNGVHCYVKPSALTRGAYNDNYVGTATLKAGAKVYQRPSGASKYVTTGKNHPVLIYAAGDGYALIRTSDKGVFGFVSASELINAKAK